MKVLVGLVAVMTYATAFSQDVDRPPLTLDEDVWATFYDVPSRRFRSIRDAFVRGDAEAVERDLEISIGFLNIEAERVPPALAAPLAETIDSMRSIRRRLDENSITVAQLDSVFARVHWILSQHYIVLAVKSRDLARHVMAGRYLFATAHHLERAVLWSNKPINRQTVRALESIRDLAGKLQAGGDPREIYEDRPIRLAVNTLQDVARHIDRTVRVQGSLAPQ